MLGCLCSWRDTLVRLYSWREVQMIRLRDIDLVYMTSVRTAVELIISLSSITS